MVKKGLETRTVVVGSGHPSVVQARRHPYKRFQKEKNTKRKGIGGRKRLKEPKKKERLCRWGFWGPNPTNK